MRDAQLPGRLSALAVAAVACGSHVPADEAKRYLAEDTFRRAELSASLVNPANDYSHARLERYPQWERLPAWNPRVAPVTPRDLGAPAARELADDAAPIAISAAATAGDPAALVALGEAAFFRYPVQSFDGFAIALRSPAEADRYGLWRDDDRVGGLVRVAMADGSVQLAYTCATCHAARRDGHLVVGLGNDALDLGRLIADASHADYPALASWGRGRADVSTAGGLEPVRLADLRPTRYLTHLQVNATVEQRGLAALALRIETLIITGHGEVVRPPREIVLGLAAYLWSLAPAGPARAPTTDAERRGRVTFDATCAECHAPPGFTGPPVELARIGVDRVGTSAARGTGRWRVPSLLGASARGALFHDGALRDVAAVLDPARLTTSYRDGRVPGPVREHAFGLELDAVRRAELVAYLKTL